MARLVRDGARRREAEAATKPILQALAMLGLATASTAVTLALSDPPAAWLDGNAYLLAVSCAFFAGVAELYAAVWVLSAGVHTATAAGVKKKMLVYGAVPLAAAVGLSMASLF